MNITTHAATLQAEQFDDLTWAMSILANAEECDADHAEWMLNTLAAKGGSEGIRLAASYALLDRRLATA